LPLYSSSYDRGEGYATRPIRPIGSSCGQVSFPINFIDLKPYCLCNDFEELVLLAVQTIQEQFGEVEWNQCEQFSNGLFL
jgi:hypothetical protein